MLEWLTGAGRHGHRTALEKDGEDVTVISEPPQTPAPVFAVRAFRTALFGTPQVAQDDGATVKHGGQIKGRQKASDGAVESVQDVLSTTRAPLGSTNANATRAAVHEVERLASATKLAGIMLTPGTERSRRKTVSFGAMVVDKEETKGTRTGRGEPVMDQSEKVVGLQITESSREGEKRTRTKTMKALYESQSQELSKPVAKRVPVEDREPKAVGRGAIKEDEDDGDVTLDMDHPRSSSGRYWKSEFDVYHDETEQAMRKLKKYKQAAKSFARAKDSETVKLSAKLREERSKVTRMEAEISQLAADLAKFRPDGPASDSRQAELMAKLTTRTARTVERQRRVDELQATLEERSSSMEKETPPEFRRVASPRTSKTIIQASEELKKARKQVQELLDLRAEMSILRMKAETAGNRADKLEKENVTLRRDLADTRKMLSKSGKGRMEGEGGKGGGATECSASAGKEDMERLGENQRGIPEPQHIPKRSSSERGPDLVKQNALPRLRGVDIPADRAAAALARLEQRRAERKKLRAPRPEATG